ncbi:MAG: capsule assembly Wzi family protein [Candidatus Acidiferrales bacterium]
MKFKREALVAFFLLSCVAATTSARCYAEPQKQEAVADNATSSDTSVAKTPSDPPQAAVESQDDSEARQKALGLRVIERMAEDQRQIWTSPARLRPVDAEWIMPLGLAAAGLFATDTEFSKHLSNSPNRLKFSRDFSNYGVGAMGGVVGGLYLWGELSHNDHASETGILAGEAALNSLGVVYALQYALGRERPLKNNYRGNFWSGGNSFPSEHAAAAWSIASVVAHEYPGPLTRVLAYGMATAVSFARIDSKQHFPSDVLIGSAIGWLSGELVYRANHDPELGGSPRQTYAEARDFLERDRPRQNMGTTFVELDSWVYPAMDRLAGLGYIQTAMQGLRPWTRMQCALLTIEAGDRLLDGVHPDSGASAIISRLRIEFSYELARVDGGRNFTAKLDSVYLRTVSIAGTDLTDGFHFGQTISYDFGRPFERGTNLQDGGSFRADLGPIAVYVRAEYQHSPGAPAPSDAVRNITALRDSVPEPPDVTVSAINRVRLLDAYFGVNVGNWQILVGRQSLSWGPGPGGSLIWSDNAEPVDMVRLVNSEPERLPGFLKYLGPATVDQFFGRLSGNYIRHPYIYGNKISVKPLPNLEIGYSRTVTIGGHGGNPLTPANFFDSFFGRQSSSTLGNSVPGDSHADFDWTFNVPKVRNYIVLYGDWYTDDDSIAFQTPKKSAFRPGIYVTHFPGLPKLDLHIEAANTATAEFTHASAGVNSGNLNYWNFVYRDGYTNDGNLIGNVVGRLGQTYEGWLTYWASSRDTLQVTYKNSSVGTAFIPGGGAWQDYGVNNEWQWKSGFYCKAQFQYEHISHFPILFNGPQHNVTSIVEIGFAPSARGK